MIGSHRDLLICDLAETYQIYDYHRVPVKILGTLVSGLGPDTRIGMKLSGRKAPMDVVLLAKIYDGLFTEKDADPLVRVFLVEDEKKEIDDGTRFDSAEDFEAARNRILRKIQHGNTGHSICTDSSISTGDKR